VPSCFGWCAFLGIVCVGVGVGVCGPAAPCPCRPDRMRLSAVLRALLGGVDDITSEEKEVLLRKREWEAVLAHGPAGAVRALRAGAVVKLVAPAVPPAHPPPARAGVYNERHPSRSRPVQRWVCIYLLQFARNAAPAPAIISAATVAAAEGGRGVRGWQPLCQPQSHAGNAPHLAPPPCVMFPPRVAAPF
jgi:hypothetical protein